MEEHSKEEFLNIDQWDNYVNTKPYKFIFLGEEVDVSCYKEMLSHFLHLLYDRKPEKLKELAEEGYKLTDTDKIYMSNDKSTKETMTQPEQIENTDIFYESKLNAEYIMKFINRLLTECKYATDDFKFAYILNDTE